MARKKNRWMGIVAGPTIVFFSLAALWKNETRFDFHRAATQTQTVGSPADASLDQLVSLTGPMDRQLTMSGDYVESFTGYVMVKRHAEIYAWDRDKDSDDNVTWDLRWMSSVQSNSRNQGLDQSLSSKRFLPAEYTVGELAISSERIEFVDATETLNQAEMPILREGLVAENEYLYLRKGRGRNLGDERVSYQAIPVPETATWFGKFDSQKGVADTSHQRDGMINQMMLDTGILHHLVAGDRTTALATMKSYITRLKWIVRAIGTASVVTGLFILFATFTGILFHIPIVGRIAEWGSFLLALIIGLPLAFLTIIASYLFAHPFILLIIAAGLTAIALMLHRRGKASQLAIRSSVEQQYGHAPDESEVKELEFLELAQLALSDSNFGVQEEQFLKRWARKHRWDDAKYDSLLAQAQQIRSTSESTTSNDEHLLNLVRLAMADGSVSNYEIKTIRKAAMNLGYDANTVRDLINRVRISAESGVGLGV